MSKWEEAPWQTQEMLDRFGLSAGLGTPLRRWIKRRRSGHLCFDGYPQNQDPGECQEEKKMDGKYLEWKLK